MLKPAKLALLSAVAALAACGNSTNGTTGGIAATSTTAATSATVSSTTSGATAGPTGSTTGATQGATTSGTAATSGSSSSTSGTGGAFQPYDGGPHDVTLPNAGAADAGCTLGDPLLSDAGGCAQCLSDSDCPAPSVCETNPNAEEIDVCVQCSIAEPTCPAGYLCDIGNSDTCVVDCSTGSSCVTAIGGYCNLDAGVGPIGCVQGCRTNADCPANAVNCDPNTFLCGNCIEDASPSGCPAGQLCGYTPDDVPGCVTDCRVDSGICIPGICDADAGSGSVQCLSDVCVSDANCAGSSSPRCNTDAGFCEQCLADTDCQALGFGTPICASGFCSIYCAGDTTGCGGEQCIFFDGGVGDTCACASDQDCAGQSQAPSCIPANPDAGLDAGAGLYGECGCRVGSCAVGTVCETRFDVLELLNPSASGSLCIPTCASGKVNCALDPSNATCNATTGYCIACSGDAQCSADAGTPSCIPLDAGLPTGGGQCGCTAAACGADVCNLTFGAGQCQPPCTYSSNGFDSCLDDVGFASPQLCNSETGLCQGCFTSADCVGQSTFSFLGSSYALDFCSDAGVCYGCNTYADCPASLPGCYGGACGVCLSSANCATGYSCSPWDTCLPSCTPTGGQCAGDGGAPLCGNGVCVQCLTTADCGDGGFEFCSDGICQGEFGE